MKVIKINKKENMNIYPEKFSYCNDFYRYPTLNNDIGIYRPKQNLIKIKTAYNTENRISLYKMERSPVQYRRMKLISPFINSPSTSRNIIDLINQSPSSKNKKFFINTSCDFSRRVNRRYMSSGKSNHSIYDSNNKQMIEKKNISIKFRGKNSDFIHFKKKFPTKIIIPSQISTRNKLLSNKINNYCSVKNNNNNIIKNDKKKQKEFLINQRYKNISINTISTNYLKNNNIKPNLDFRDTSFSENELNKYEPKKKVYMSENINLTKNILNKGWNNRYIFDARNKNNTIVSAEIKKEFSPRKNNNNINYDNLLISTPENYPTHHQCITERNIFLPKSYKFSPHKKAMLIYKLSPSKYNRNFNKYINIKHFPNTNNYVTNNNIFIKLKNNPTKWSINGMSDNRISRLKKILGNGFDKYKINENSINQNVYHQNIYGNNNKNNCNKIILDKRTIKNKNYFKRIHYITENNLNQENKTSITNFIDYNEKYNNNIMVEIKKINNIINKDISKNTNKIQIKKSVLTRENGPIHNIIYTKNDNYNENKKYKELDGNTISLTNSKINESISPKKEENNSKSIQIPFFIENFSVEFNPETKILSIVGTKNYKSGKFCQRKIKNTIDDSEDEFQLTREIELLKNTLTTRNDFATKIIKIIKSLKITHGFQETFLGIKDINTSASRFYKITFYYSDNMN